MVKGQCSVIVLCGLVCDSVLGIRCFVEVGGRLGRLGGEVAVPLLQEHLFAGGAVSVGAVGTE